MVVLFLNCDKIKGNIKNFKGCDLVVFGFSEFSPQFLEENYYILVEKLKGYSLKFGTQFVLSFFINKLNRRYLGAIRVARGKVLNIFGACFSKKNLRFKVEKKIVSVLFYYDLYAKKGREVAKFSSVIIGIDDDEILEQTAFLSNKFFDKLILVNKNTKIYCGKIKKIKNKLKICENVFYKI